MLAFPRTKKRGTIFLHDRGLATEEAFVYDGYKWHCVGLTRAHDWNSVIASAAYCLSGEELHFHHYLDTHSYDANGRYDPALDNDQGGGSR